MTKQEAKDLESKIDKLFSERLETDCEISMALTGALRISVNEGFFNIKVNTKTVDWVKWNGDYGLLQEYIRSATLVISENRFEIEELMQSYYNKPFLKESED